MMNAPRPRLPLAWLLLLFLVASQQAPAQMHSVPPESVPGAAGAAAREVGFDQRLGANVPLDAEFRDAETQRVVTLGQTLAAGRPTILLLGYHECPMLCSAVLNGLVETMNDLRWTAGREFDLVDVDLNPAEPTTLAASKRRIYLKRYSRPGAGTGWHFLTAADRGNDEAIRRLADRIGFRYRYDPSTGQYAHASGFVVLTPEGQVSRYFFGVNFNPQELHDALAAAGAHEVSRSPIEQLLLLCFHYNPIQGKYGGLILGALRGGAVATLLALAGGIFYLTRRERRPRLEAAPAAAR